MNRIGIVFAMKEELEETKKYLKNAIEHKIYDLVIYECDYKGNKCFLIESGIGKVNAARATQILISVMQVDCLLNVGVAGSVSRNVNKCDVVIADKLVQHDFDLTALGIENNLIPGVGKYIECDKEMLEIAKDIEQDTNVFIGNIASGDIFVSNNEMASKIHEAFNALCVEMEGAAIAQVSYLCNIPFLVIRAISDSPYEENNNNDFIDYLKMSSDIASKFAIKLLEKITQIDK